MVPALAVAEALRAEGARVAFIGGERAEATLVPQAGYELHRLRVVALPRRAPLRAAQAVAIDAAALLGALRLLRALKPEVVLGGGGYMAAPVGVAAALLRIPLVAVEIDGHLGMANRLLAPLAARVCTALPISSDPKFVVTGRPVPAVDSDRSRARERFAVAEHETLVLVFGGSLGARSINEAALEAFADAPFRVLHAAGERDLPALRAPRDGYDLRGYVPDFMDALVAADLVVARSGGSIWEICAAGRASVLVPYPHATADHQTLNARHLADAGAALMIPDAALDARRLREVVDGLLGDRERLTAMGAAAAALARPRAAQEIAGQVLALARSRGAGGPAAGAETGAAQTGVAATGAAQTGAAQTEPAQTVATQTEAPAERPAADWSARRLHFVGIGGAGMSGLALIARTLGAQVSGSDRAESAYMPALREAGIEPVIGHAAQNVPAGAEVVYSSAIPADSPERLAAAAQGGGGELHRAQLLAQIAQLKRCIAVSGTHGKTTTTSMIVHTLRGCGMDPAYVIGGALRSTGTNAAWGSGEWIVIEADESDRSLLNYRPEIALVTNAELDHHATYDSRLAVERTFVEFLSHAHDAIVWDRPQLLELAARAAVPGRVLAYDAQQPRLDADGARLRWHGLDVRLSVPGLHNAVNAAGALSACALAGAEPAAAVAAIADFQGAKRRLERLGETAAGAAVYDDYAHHPTEVAAALAAARTLRPGRLVAVFQPHLYSRTRALAREFGQALAQADVVVVLDIYPARESAADFPGVCGRLVAAAAADAAAGRAVLWLPTAQAARSWLDGALRAGDLCVVIGAGDVDQLGRALVEGERPTPASAGH